MANMGAFHSGGTLGVGGGLILPVTLGIAFLQALIDSLTDGEIRVHLFVGATVPTPATVLADFVEADFTGYAAVDVVPTAPAENPEGWAQIDFPTAHFEASGGATPNTVTGFYLTDNTDALYLGGQRFDNSFIFDETGDYFDVDGSLQLLDASQVPAP